MAKNIKAIRCPQCGSTKIQELKEDYYKCKSCETEFFLDSDDININHSYNFPSKLPINRKKIIWGVLGFLFIFIIVPRIISSIFSSNSTPTSSSRSSIIHKITEEKSIYSFEKYGFCIFEDKNGEPNIFIIGKIKNENYRSASNEPKDDSFYTLVYNMKTGKQSGLQRIDDKISGDRVEIESNFMEDKNVYFIINKKNVYKYDVADRTIQLMNETYMKNNKKLAVGFAKVEFLQFVKGFGYSIVTNDGSKLILMPLINEVYDSDDEYKMAISPLPQPTIKIGYQFSSKSTDYPKEKLQLIKYKYNYQKGYLKNNLSLRWTKDYGRSGIFTGNEPHKKVLFMNGAGRIVSFTDLTPNRIYFSPKVLDYTDDKVFITYKPTPADDEQYHFQVLDGTSGDILTTLDYTMSYNPRQAMMVRDGYLFSVNNVVYVDKNGKVQREIKYINDIKIENYK